jgi:hypothetical protein
MFATLGPTSYLLFSWGLVTLVLATLLVYSWTVSKQEDRFHFKKLEDERVAAQERFITEKMSRLRRGIVPLAVLSGLLLLATAAVWVWSGLKG